MDEYVLRFQDVGMGDVPRVGGKNASLGEMIRNLGEEGVRVPDGFATTAFAYRSFVEANGLGPAIDDHLRSYREGSATLHDTGESLRELFLAGTFPPEISEAILESYRDLAKRSGLTKPAVAVRSSATAEDLPEASFAGAQETFLNVVGERQLLDACRRCYASLFTDRAISYREAQHFDHLDVALSIGVQRMVRSDIGGSGIMFSIDTDSGFPGVAVISAAWGLGELVVQGSVDPDRYLVFKSLISPGITPIVEKTKGAKLRKMVYSQGATARTRIVDTPAHQRRAFVLSDEEIVSLARWAVVVERHYGRPMDMEWARDGITNEMFMVQARPETVQSTKSDIRFAEHHLTQEGTVLLSGAAVGDSIAAGSVCVIKDPADIDSFRDGSVLVAEMTDPDWVSIMTRASGIITDHGGSTSHAAIVSRELGIPAIVGTGHATELLKDHQLVTLSCAEGDVGRVYDGILGFETTEVDLHELPSTRTSVMVNVASPDAAFRWWRLPAAGVGLARMEFIINDLIRVHPMALLHPDRVLDAEDRELIRQLTAGFADPSEFFVQTLAMGLAKLASPYHPHKVIVRLSDFKTNEYAHLIGGGSFEQAEENPMLGFRGASRYYDPRYREGFALECRAIKQARDVIGFSNIVVMVPFCRTPHEADRVLEELARNGLVRGENGLAVYMMCEIPSNVIRAAEFAERFDGFSIGSNDLTQLVLGVDRDSAALAALFDERDEAVEWMIAQAIEKAHAAGIPIGICGQAPSDHPDFVDFLVEHRIDSISLNPDSFLATVGRVAEAEARQAAEARTPAPMTR